MSTSLKELQSWRLAKVVHVMGDRRDHFETSTDIWELFKLIVEGRRQREIDPTLTVLRDSLVSPEMTQESRDTEQRIRDTLQFLETLTTWSDEMLRMKPETLMKTLGMGAKISRTVRRTKGQHDSADDRIVRFFWFFRKRQDVNCFHHKLTAP